MPAQPAAPKTVSKCRHEEANAHTGADVVAAASAVAAAAVGARALYADQLCSESFIGDVLICETENLYWQLPGVHAKP